MILDYFPKTGLFGLSVPRKERELIDTLVTEHGLDFSATASTQQAAMLIPNNVYAASAYAEYATPAAKKPLAEVLPHIETSWSKQGRKTYYSADGQASLWPFQSAGLEYALPRLSSGTGVLVGDEPGLGKTPTTVAIANEIGVKRVLVVCPANIRLQWAKQIRVWSHMEGKYTVYPILKSADGVHPRAEWTVLSYDLLRSEPIRHALRSQRFDLLVLDEAHYLKTPYSQRTLGVFGDNGVVGSCGATLALTGTPLPNRSRECYTMARNLCWSAIDFAGQKEFYERYNPVQTIERKNSAGQIVGRATRQMTGRAPELQARLRANFMVRRLKRDVLEQLPEIRYEIVHVEETGDVKKALEAEKMLDINPEDIRIDAEILGHMSVVRHMMGVAMAPQVASYADYVLDGGVDKLVIFTWHKTALDILEAALSKYGVIRVDGSTSPARRQMAVDAFVEKPEKRVFVGNLEAVGTGVDGLQKVCSRAIFAESDWTWAKNEQGIGRLERIGQNSAILVEFMVAPGSISERVLGTSLRKLQGIHAALDKRTM